MQLAGSVVVVIMNHALKENGGDLAIGASGIISSIAMLLVMLIIGIAQGMQPIVGFNHGAGHHDRVLATLRLSIIVSTLITGVGCIVSLLFPRLIVSVFSTDAELVSITDNGLRLTMLVFFVVGSQITISPVFQSYRCRMESDVSESKSAGFIPDTGYPAISSDLGIGWRLASATFLRFHCGGNRMGLFMVSC